MTPTCHSFGANVKKNILFLHPPAPPLAQVSLTFSRLRKRYHRETKRTTTKEKKVEDHEIGTSTKCWCYVFDSTKIRYIYIYHYIHGLYELTIMVFSPIFRIWLCPWQWKSLGLHTPSLERRSATRACHKDLDLCKKRFRMLIDGTKSRASRVDSCYNKTLIKWWK